MVRIVGGECTGSCRLGHVFLTFLSFPPSPVHSLLSPPHDSFFFCFYSLYLRREERRRGRNRVAREREKEATRHDKQRWSGREEWWKEGEGTRYFTSASLFLALSISPSLHLGTVDARSIITLPLSFPPYSFSLQTFLPLPTSPPPPPPPLLYSRYLPLPRRPPTPSLAP